MSDEIFEVLADRYRRRLLVALIDRNPMTVSTRAERNRERSPTADDPIQKRHVHLPKLAGYGFIDWNREQDIVVKGPRFDEIEPVLELLIENGDVLPEDCF